MYYHIQIIPGGCSMLFCLGQMKKIYSTQLKSGKSESYLNRLCKELCIAINLTPNFEVKSVLKGYL